MTDVTEAVPAIASTPRPGWYQDPRSADSVRWWNGAGWTGDVRSKPVAAPVAPAPAPAAPALTPAPAAPAPVTHSAGPSAVPPIPVPPWATPGVNYGPVPTGMLPPLASTPALAAPHPSGGPSSQVLAPTLAWGPPTTGAAWVLAALPLIWIATRVAGSVVEALGGGIAAIVIGLITLPGAALASLMLARRDGRQLRARGYRPPHQAWILLASPVVYLAIRAHRIHEGGGRSRGPVVLGAISLAALWAVIGGIAAVSISLAMQSSTGLGTMYGGFDRYGNPEAGVVPTRADVERYIEDSENVRYGIRVQVSCGSEPLEPLSAFTCAGQDSTGTTRSYVAKITDARTVTYAPGAVDEEMGAEPLPDAG